MRHHKVLWPWQQYAYAGHNSHHKHSDSPHSYESRWHKSRGANFGVRRPLRYLAHRLDLDDSQLRRMASVLNQLKTEQEQAMLDEKRSVAKIAELLAAGTPTLEQCRETLESRVDTTRQMNDETARAMVTISELLDDDQREEFVNLLLTGSFSL